MNKKKILKWLTAIVSGFGIFVLILLSIYYLNPGKFESNGKQIGQYQQKVLAAAPVKPIANPTNEVLLNHNGQQGLAVFRPMTIPSERGKYLVLKILSGEILRVENSKQEMFSPQEVVAFSLPGDKNFYRPYQGGYTTVVKLENDGLIKFFLKYGKENDVFVTLNVKSGTTVQGPVKIKWELKAMDNRDLPPVAIIPPKDFWGKLVEASKRVGKRTDDFRTVAKKTEATLDQLKESQNKYWTENDSGKKNLDRIKKADEIFSGAEKKVADKIAEYTIGKKKDNKTDVQNQESDNTEEEKRTPSKIEQIYNGLFHRKDAIKQKYGKE